MAKVSVGLRGWRFEEEAIFDEEGNFRELSEMEEDLRDRLVRLAELAGSPCDACWLIHGEADIEQCNVAEAVYGEYQAEVIVCGEHEDDLVYWYQEAGGREFRGSAEFQDEFYDWFEAGNRAPDSFEGIEHVDTDPLEVPTPEAPDDEEREARWEVQEEMDLRDVDMNQDYPTG